MTSPPYWEQAVLLWNKARDEAPSSAIRAIAEALGDADHQSFKRGNSSGYDEGFSDGYGQARDDASAICSCAEGCLP